MGQGSILRSGDCKKRGKSDLPRRHRRCRYAWDKIKRLLAKHDATVENIDKVVTYVTDIRYFFDAGKCRTEAFAGATQPAGTFLVISALAWPGMLIEVDVTASTP